MTTPSSVLIYVMRRELRASDQPIFHHLASTSSHGFSHLLPVYVFHAKQIDISGFVSQGSMNPYPPARSRLGNYPRCGPHRARFLGESVVELQQSLESLGSGLVIRVGMTDDVVRSLAEGLTTNGYKVAAIWMTSHEGTEEKHDEKTVADLCGDLGAGFRLWEDEKYLIDDRDVGLEDIQALPDIFTTYYKSKAPLRENPRAVLPTPVKGSLPPMPDAVPAQTAPFTIPASGEELIARLVEPVKQFLPPIPTCSFPENVESAHPFRGGEAAAQARIKQFLRSGFLANYKNARRGLAKDESSTKLSAYLAQGCITARQVHRFLVGYENGTEVTLQDVDGYGRGEHEGTEALRAGLLWRDYMRLCHQKFKSKFFCVEGFRGDGHGDGDGEAGEQKKMKWKSAAEDMALPDHKPSTRTTAEILERFNAGTTGIGLIDASQRELLHTGYTSNRARQNVASFLSRHLGIDWRYGAEWYEMLLVDYDVSSNWANWQYMAGVGNDPRSGLRIFNPVKQALEYDKDGQYIKSWVPELRGLGKLENVFQAWTASAEDVEAAGLGGNIMVTDPVKRIAFTIEDRPRTRKRSGHARRGRRGGRGGKGDRPENGAVATGDTVISASAGKEGTKFSPPSTAPNIHLSANSGAGCSALPKGPNPSPRADGQRPYRRGRGRGRPRGSSRGRGARGRGG